MIIPSVLSVCIWNIQFDSCMNCTVYILQLEHKAELAGHLVWVWNALLCACITSLTLGFSGAQTQDFCHNLKTGAHMMTLNTR